MSITLSLIILVALVFVSGFFSSSETAMMSLNRYRLRHLARTKHRGARRVFNLLKRTDRLLGVILIGNTFANILASSIATVVFVHFFGDYGILIATISLTLIILIFAEVAPKTYAASHPQRLAFIVSIPLNFLLKIFYPIVWLVNSIANGLLKLLRVNIKSELVDHLSSDELSTLVQEAGGKIPVEHQIMLLGILQLEKITVNDVMIPRKEIIGIDLDDDWSIISEQIMNSQHTRIPVFQGEMDTIKGILHIRSALKLLSSNNLTLKSLMKVINEPYFIPEHTPLHKQLINFRENKTRVALVVDEYGDIQGLVMLEDILEEIVGEFTTNLVTSHKQTTKQKDGSYLIEASINMRDLNRMMDWDFDTSGPKTLSGLIIESLESIPKAGIGMRISGYPIEVVKVKGNSIQFVKVYPKLKTKVSALRKDAKGK